MLTQAAELLEHTIGDAERAVREFEGIEQQLYVLQEFLRLLERAGHFDAWIQYYLKALCEHPTHTVVARFATEAVRISKLAGQQQQVLDALRHLAALPTEMAGRSEIEVALDSAQPRLARLDAHSGGDAMCGSSFAGE